MKTNATPLFEGKAVGAGPGPFLKELDFEIHEGEWLSLIGPNGSGKTTLLHALSGWIPHQGILQFRGRPLADLSRREFARHVAVLRNDETAVFGFSVGEWVESGTYAQTGAEGLGGAAAAHTAREALEHVGAASLWERPVTSLSSGEFQRVCLARTLAQRTPVILLDEPSAHLDPGQEATCFELLAQGQRHRGQTIVCVCHDLALAAHFSDRILLLREGRIVAQGAPSEVLSAELLQSAYGCPFRVERDPLSQRLVPRALAALCGSFPVPADAPADLSRNVSPGPSV